MKVHKCKQGTPEWFMARLGKPTSSEATRIITPGGAASKSEASEKYMYELIADRLRNCPPDDLESWKSRAMLHGTNTEPEARSHYAVANDVNGQEVGFCETDDGFAGFSPDWLIEGGEGHLEIKCPELKTHLKYMSNPAALSHEYGIQCHYGLWVRGGGWCDLMSYHPPAFGKIFPDVTIRIHAGDMTKKIAAAMREFKDRYDEAWEAVRLAVRDDIDTDHPFI